MLFKKHYINQNARLFYSRVAVQIFVSVLGERCYFVNLLKSSLSEAVNDR